MDGLLAGGDLVVIAKVCTHLGLGDHIICNGLVRELAKRHGRVITYAKPHNMIAVMEMFYGVNVEVAPASEMPHDSHPVLYRIGFEWRDRALPFDADFYRIAHVPFAKRWNSFGAMLPTDQVGPIPKEPYVFLHEDVERGFLVDRGRIPSGVRVVEAEYGKTPSIFGYYALMAKAAQIHVIDSAFLFLADSYPELGGKTTTHRYARSLPEDEIPTLMRVKRVLT